MQTNSPVSAPLIRLQSVNDFVEHSLKTAQTARRRLFILSENLDPYVYDTDEMFNALSEFVRRSRNIDLRILVHNGKDLVERGHRLARLHQRLTSKVQLREITLEPNNRKMAFICADQQQLVYKNDDSAYFGFANPQAASEIKSLSEEFRRIWEFARDIPDLRSLYL
ncbi:hypothetical protein KO507_05345 [Gilvimarinus agarilyticus]|uniref:DUF7931 domain-containing protein n=1 Tax=unclassified Gilvimarinus TaxID=2642066 RepID=UPI001C08D5A4|nr:MULTISPECIES: hypothetical protein [unclassified Gilvimarinus]MBU2885185.1 hypothetical protein [Gilvimarinus agarilyticus]MDO6570084.1 hypothetical protein [Gilvimarinus sp. 2_MG-2023]MDO6745635.1 hypothetical protein [Gilvimarinus sp. 1_MG-2023]